MTPDKIPQPIIAAQPIVTTIRQAQEECSNQLDATSGVRTLELDPVILPSGEVATVRCARDRKGHLRITISFAPVAK